MLTRTYFKNVDRNGYVSTRSCYHSRWIGAIPKGQVIRVKRNCHDKKDYLSQSDKLIERFNEKGFKRKDLTKTWDEIGKRERNEFLTQKQKKEQQVDMAFITGYHTQYKSVEKIVRKYWPILLKNPILSKTLPKRPLFMYRKAPGIRNRIAKNVLDPPKRPTTFLERKGFF